MRVELQALQRIMGQSQVAESLIKLALGQLNAEMEKALADGLDASIQDYSKCHLLEGRLSGVKDLGAKYHSLAEAMPIFLCNLAGKLIPFQDQPKALIRYLCASSDFLIYSTMGNGNLHQPILQSLSPEDNVAKLKEKLESSNHEGYLPRILRQDFLTLAGILTSFPTLKTRQDAIEALYFLRALTAIYYRIFFNALLHASKDQIAEHLTAIFSILFVALRRFEINMFIKGPIPQRKLDYIIERDDANLRHPLLRKHIFTMLVNYNPLLSDGKGQSLNVTGQRILRSQLEALHAMTDHRLTLFMLVVKRYRGKAYLQALLSSLQRTGADRVGKFYHSLSGQQGSEAKEVLEEVRVYLSRITGKVRPGHAPAPKPKMLTSFGTIRQMEAKRNLAANKNRHMMSHNDVEEYLRRRLEKLYAKVRKEGALTKDKIPEYLAQFAEASIEIMHDRDLTEDEITEFETSTCGLLDDIAKEANVDRASLVEHEQEILQHTAELKTASVEDRADIVSNIGVTLMDAQKKLDQPESKKSEEEDITSLLKVKAIAIGLEENAPCIPIKDFFEFPLGPRGGPETEEVWFDLHLKYLEALLTKGKLDSTVYDKIKTHLEKFEKYRYRKYFDIFPGGSY